MMVLLNGAVAEITLPSFFSENMVIQRDVPVPVWGWAPDGEPITVLFGNQKHETVAKDGRWEVKLDPTPAGGPYTLAIIPKDATQIKMFTQVLVGDVWIVAGQSNSLMPLHDCEGWEQAVETRDKYPRIRVASFGRRDTQNVKTPQQQAYSFWGACKWEEASYLATRWSKGGKSQAESVPGNISGLTYFFARDLRDILGDGVPIGILQLGAILPVQAWVDDETVAATPELAPLRGKDYPHATSSGFNDQVAPLAPFPVRGVVYYQGEMNAGRGKGPFYIAGLTAMIESWRKAWNNPDLPFLIVQLAGFIKHQGPEDKRLDMDAATLASFAGENVDHGYCHVREAQDAVTRKIPGTAMVVTYDVGDPYDIHPRKKAPVADRLALQARRIVYGEKDLAAGSPRAEEVRFNGAECRVQFSSAEGLTATGPEVKGFELSADGTTFVPAQAKIEGTTVVVSSPEVPSPKAVRFAWAGWPEANLINKAGLPAGPFRFPGEVLK